MRAGQNGGQRNCQGRDMSQRVEVRRACAAAHPQPFLTCGFEAGIVTLTLCTQGVCSLETEAAAVNGKPVVIGKGLIFRAAPVFLAVVPILVVTRANTGFGLTEWAAEFLPGTIIVGGFAIFVHSQSSITDQVTCRKSFALGIAFFAGDKSLALIDRFYGIVDAFHIVALVGKEGASTTPSSYSFRTSLAMIGFNALLSTAAGSGHTSSRTAAAP